MAAYKNPVPTVDIIIQMYGYNDKIVLIERLNEPHGWALPGGFVDYGETLEAAAEREAREETGLDVEDLRQFHTYSDPTRDARLHTISTVFVGRSRGIPVAADDALRAEVFDVRELPELMAFDHRSIVTDYIKRMPEDHNVMRLSGL